MRVQSVFFVSFLVLCTVSFMTLTLERLHYTSLAWITGTVVLAANAIVTIILLPK
jgi:hypothetical protein